MDYIKSDQVLLSSGVHHGAKNIIVNILYIEAIASIE